MQSFGTIPESEHMEEKQDAFFWVTLDEQNTILVISHVKVEIWTESFWKRFILKNGIGKKSVLFTKFMSPWYSFDSFASP